MANYLWKIILGCVFLRPFVSLAAFPDGDLFLNSIFIPVSSLYIFLKRPAELSLISKTAIVFLASIVLSAFFSLDIIASFKALYIYFSLILLFLAVRSSDKKQQRQLIVILIVSGLLLSSYSLRSFFVTSNLVVKYMSENRISYPFAEEFLSRHRAFSPFVSPNLLANYIIMLIIICLTSFAKAIKTKGEKALAVLSILCITSSALVLLLTKALAGWITFTVCIIIFLIASRILRKKSLFIAAGAAVILAILFYLRTKGKHFTTPLYSLQQRLCYWKGTLYIIKRYPITGVGIGNFNLPESRMAHNSYLQIWAEMGIAAIISWITLAVLFLKNIIRKIKASSTKVLPALMLTAGCAFLIHNMIDYSFFSIQASFLWWIVLGLADSSDSILENS